ncbi:MAG: nicotinate-nucleotide adenylyltransferase [Solirubrobacteraceae bacterium]
MASVGLLGGTFNPPHVGHLVCAMEAREALGLDVVRLVVAAVPPHKEVPGDPGVEVRLELCALAAAQEPGLEVSRVEADRPGPSYTADTLRALLDAAPQDELTFIVGGDQALGLPGWHEPETVLSLAHIAVAGRGDVSRDEILHRCADLDVSRLEFFAMPRLDVSSTDLRARVTEGRPIRHLVPAAVADRVGELGLYA